MALLDLDLNPDRRILRRFGAAAFVAFGALAVLGCTLWTFPTPLVVALGALALLSGLFAVGRPAWNRPLYLVLTLLFFPVGLVVSYVVLAVLFFGILTPVGLVFRLFGRDALRRRWEPEATTYWVDRAGPVDLKRYFRPF